MATIVPPNHPEANQTDLVQYTEQQLADIASTNPQTAARLALEYAQAKTVDSAASIGMDIEEARITALRDVRGY